MTGDRIAIENKPASPDGPVRPTFLVGIGASAGGLEALEQLFEHVPTQTGFAFIVVQHLSPDFKSLTGVLLARRTNIPIYSVENGMEVRPDAIYLIPPKKDMIISNGRLLLTDKDRSQLMTMPIDHFFRSLAQDAGERAIGVILSGTGSDGSRGIRDVHDAGGLVIVQKADTAKFDGMPISAEKTGVVNSFLAPEEIPEALLRHAARYVTGQPDPRADADHRDQESGMESLFRILKTGYGIDFSQYRLATVERRIDRRVQINNARSLSDYVRQLEENPEEVNTLYKDLLIGVTSFMRDSDAFASLATILPQLIEQASEKGEELRVWVAGCATGEEAYSMAILLREGLDALGKEIPVKIFATDVHRASLEFASTALYPESSLTDMTPERLARHFIRKGDNYQISPELRKMVVFAPHNVLKDAPFTKLSLITCRNLLIYFQLNSQKKVLSLFHFGLKTGGVLFLGPSESAGELGDEFDLLDSRWKILRKRRDVRLPAGIRISAPVVDKSRHLSSSNSANSMIDAQLFSAYNVLLSNALPPSLLVNARRELVQTFAEANRFLKKDGLFSSDVLEMVTPDLRAALTGALQRVLAERQPVTYKSVRMELPEGTILANVTVNPVQLPRNAECLALISIEEIGVTSAPESMDQVMDLGRDSQEHVLSLEAELRFTKENLQATIEELETSNEELQATNEELVASNEELQSTNEELHSVNEELYTVNAEHQNKIAQLTELSIDVENLLASTEVHTVFLDRDLCIRKFTPKIAQKFNFLPQDVGRRIDSFTHNIDHPTLLADLQSVLSNGEIQERQVRDQRGDWYLMRVLPYRVGLGVGGVVLTLIDISSLKRLEEESRGKDRQLAGILENSPNPISITDRQGRYVIADSSFRQIVGDDPTGKSIAETFPPEAARVLLAARDCVLAEGRSVQTEVDVTHGGEPHTYLAILFPLWDEHKDVCGVGNIMTDVTQLKVAESRALEAVTQRDRFLAMLSHELRNPLAAILNTVCVAERSELTAENREWLSVIDRRARHVARLLDDLLEVTRLTQNKIEIRKVAFDLASTMSDAIEEVRAWFDNSNVQLTVHCSNDPLLVEGDPTRLQQIQVNLLRNAAKYTPSGGHVWYSLQREEGQAVIRVRDNGIGIAPDMLDKVFDLFVQVENSPDWTGGGIGVGLTLVKSIVELHGGAVQIYSDGSGQGSEFTVRLPLIKGSAPEPVSTPSNVRRVRPAPHLIGREILVVEDDEDIRFSLKSILECDGFRVQLADDGPSALAILNESQPHVALLDIGLPGMSGYELARAIRQRRSEGVRLVALTGYGQIADRQATREAGFDAHLTKPLKPADLYKTLASLIPPEGENLFEEHSGSSVGRE